MKCKDCKWKGQEHGWNFCSFSANLPEDSPLWDSEDWRTITDLNENINCEFFKAAEKTTQEE